MIFDGIISVNGGDIVAAKGDAMVTMSLRTTLRCHQGEVENMPELHGLVGGWATPLKNMKVNWDD